MNYASDKKSVWKNKKTNQEFKILIFVDLPTRFRMKCHLCVNYIEMQTDPATCDYVIVSGASRKEERWDMAENEQILTTGTNSCLSIKR